MLLPLLMNPNKLRPKQVTDSSRRCHPISKMRPLPGFQVSHPPCRRTEPYADGWAFVNIRHAGCTQRFRTTPRRQRPFLQGWRADGLIRRLQEPVARLDLTGKRSGLKAFGRILDDVTQQCIDLIAQIARRQFPVTDTDLSRLGLGFVDEHHIGTIGDIAQFRLHNLA